MADPRVAASAPTSASHPQRFFPIHSSLQGFSTFTLLSTAIQTKIEAHTSSRYLQMPLRARYSISRKATPDKPHAVEFEFDPPVDSDELHDALREAYPHKRNLQQRISQAVIDFCLREQQEAEQRVSAPRPSFHSQHSTQSSSPRSSSWKIYSRSSISSFSSLNESDHETTTLQLIVRPPKRKLDSGGKAFPGAVEGDINSHLHTFRLSKKGKAVPRSPKPKVQQQRDTFGNLKSACDHHNKKKKKVRVFSNPGVISTKNFSALWTVRTGRNNLASHPLLVLKRHQAQLLTAWHLALQCRHTL